MDFVNGLGLDYQYDRHGNITDRDTGNSGPDGLHFTGRTHTNNQIDNLGFDYDANGNLIEEPVHEAVGGYRYSFSPENRINLVRGLDGGKIYQESLYDAGGNRWARVISADGGKGLLTLRDASGQVAAEYEESSATSGLEPKKQYVRANGKLVAVHSVCGPAPLLELTVPPLDPPNLTLTKTDFVLPTTGDYTIVIQSESGATNSLTLDQNSQNTFTIQASELFDGNNWVRIKAQVDWGDTGYSNAVSYKGGGSDCLETMEVAHTAFEGGTRGQSLIEIQADDEDCIETHQYNAYYSPEGTGFTQGLASGLDRPYWEIPNTPFGAGHGEYWFTEYDPQTHQEVGLSPAAINNSQNSSNGSNGLPGTSSWKTEYIHSDHLGSTRLVTDEMGQFVAGYKYYPFGHEAQINGVSDVRMKFTGHERDSQLGLDYMLARYYGASLVRFLSVDPSAESIEVADPQTWNRFAYSLNSPVRFIDPDGAFYADAVGQAIRDRLLASGSQIAVRTVEKEESDPVPLHQPDRVNRGPTAPI